MKLLGRVSYRDEDGTWYAEKREGRTDVWGWAMDVKEAIADFTPDEALVVMARLHEQGKHAVRYTAQCEETETTRNQATGLHLVRGAASTLEAAILTLRKETP